MPRILRIANRFNLGGPTFNVAYLTKYMPSNYETLLIGGDKEENEASSSHILQDLGIEPIIIPEMKRELSPGLDWNAYKKVKKIIRDFKPDIVHTHAAKAGAIGRQAASDLNVPVIVHTFHGHVFHSYFGRYKTQFYKSIERNMAKKSSAIIAISDIQKHELTRVHRICEEDKIQVIPLGFNLNQFKEDQPQKRLNFRNELQLEEDEVAIGIIGRLVPIKNHSYFLRLIRHLMDYAEKPFKAVIVGDGEERANIENLATELNIPYCSSNETERLGQSKLIFTSWRTDIDTVNAGLDIVVLTSKNEGTPVSLIEAQASNTVVISTDVGGVANVVKDQVTGLVVSIDNELLFADQLKKLVEDENLRKKLSEQGWEHVGKQFHYERLIKDMDRLYSNLLINRSSS
ncbi:MAG: glycosyltransferase [Flavobacteriales bacterium]|nr:glycosyltransferase [Flavobacteriales bacterium]